MSNSLLSNELGRFARQSNINSCDIEINSLGIVNCPQQITALFHRDKMSILQKPGYINSFIILNQIGRKYLYSS